MKMHNFEAVLFDFDGVLVDSEPVHFRCWKPVLEPYGIELDWELYRKAFIGVSDRKMLSTLAELSRVPVTVEELYANYGRKKELFASQILLDVPWADGVLDLVHDLSSTTKLAVVTSSGRNEVEPVLEVGGLLPLLGAAVYGGDVTRHKPEPEPYLLAAERLGVSRALVVEDSEAGLLSGQAAGFEVLRIPRPCDTASLVRARLNM